MNTRIANSELDLLLFLADRGPLPTGALHREYGQPRGIGRTSILKTLERLSAKGLALREDVGNLWHYRSARTRSELEQERVRDFVQSSFGGDARPLLQFLSGGAQLDPDDVEELQALVDRLSGGKEK